MARTFWKYFVAWLLPYALFALMFIFIILAAQALGQLPFPTSIPPVLLTGAAIFGLWKLNRLYWSCLMLRNFMAATDFAKGKFPALEQRVKIFATYISEVCAGSPADEILIIGHSFGTQLAALAAAEASRNGAFKNLQNRARLLSLGDASCHIGSLQGPGAESLREAVIHLGEQQDLPWLVLYSAKDVLCFNTTDPPSALSTLTGRPRRIADFHWPLMKDVRFRNSLPRKDYERLRWRFFHMHSQFIFAARLKTARYDYLRVVCGGEPLPITAHRIAKQKRT